MIKKPILSEKSYEYLERLVSFKLLDKMIDYYDLKLKTDGYSQELIDKVQELRQTKESL